MPILRKKTRIASEIPTASMADVAFLLLIFFLVTTIFDEERGLSVTLPQPQQQVEVQASDILHLRVLPGGVVEARLGEGPARAVGPERVGAVWREALAANAEVVASVETHPEASYEAMIEVLDALKAAGAERVALQMLEAGA